MKEYYLFKSKVFTGAASRFEDLAVKDGFTPSPYTIAELHQHARREGSVNTK